MGIVLGLDVGSSSVKASLLDSDSGRSLASEKYPELEMEISSPQSGWAEQNPEYWWECVNQAIQKVCSKSKVPPEQIQSIGISYQMHGLVALDELGKPVRPSIIWCDSRAAQLGKDAGNKIGDKTVSHLLNSPGNFTSSKLRWVKLNEPDMYQRIHSVMLPGDYIAFRLTNEINTTIGGLSEGIFWDFKQNKISPEVLDVYEIDQKLLPPLVPTIGIQSLVSAEGEKLTGIKKGTPIAYRAGDQPNNAMSLGVMEPGAIAATGGTSGVVYAVTDQLISDPSERINSFAHVNHSEHSKRIGLLMCINGTGIQYAWLRRILDPAKGYDELEKKAQEVKPGSDGLIALPFGNGAERIFNNKIIGGHLSQLDFNRHGASHLLRAGLEGIAFTFQYGLECLKELGFHAENMRVGNDNLFQSQIFSETLATLSGCQIDVYNTSGAEGAARAAAVGAGLKDSLKSYQPSLEKINSYAPLIDSDEYHNAYLSWKEELKKHI